MAALPAASAAARRQRCSIISARSTRSSCAAASLETTIGELVPDSPWRGRPSPGCAACAASTRSPPSGLAAEIGDLTRFERPGKLMSYLGLVPSENSSGETRRQGGITKTGSTHARRLLVEATWHYRKTPARGVTLARRQDGQPAHVVAISWQAQQRLHRVWRRLGEERGKRSTIVAVAVARELAGFCWALAAPTETGTAPNATSVEKGGENPPTRESIGGLTMSSPQVAGHARS